MVQAPSITTTVADGLRGAKRHEALAHPTLRQPLTDLGQETPPPEQRTPEALAAHQKADSKRRTSRPSEPTWILSSATHVLPIGHQANLSISGWNKVVSSPADVYDAKGCLACPGLIETHIHLDKSIRSPRRCARAGGWGALLICRVTGLAGLVASVCDWLEPLLDPRSASEPDELAPVLDLLRDELREFVRRSRRARDEAHLIDQLLLALGTCDVTHDLVVQPVDDRARRTRWRHQHLPGRRIESLHRIADRRNVRQRSDALGRRHADRAHLAGRDLWQGWRRIAEQQWNVTGDHIVKSGHRSAVRDVRHLHAGQALEHLAVEMVRGAEAARSEAELARVLLGVLDKIGDRIDWRGGIDHEDERQVRHHRDRLKVLHRVVGDFLIESRIDRHGGARRHQQRVAIGRSLRDGIHPDLLARAGPVLDHKRLAHPLLPNLLPNPLNPA